MGERAFNRSHRFHLSRRELAGEEGGRIEQFVSVIGPPDIGRTALPVDFPQRGTLKVLPFCVVDILTERGVPQGRLQKYLIGTERTAETGAEAWLLLYQITAESIGDAHPIAALAEIIASAAALKSRHFLKQEGEIPTRRRQTVRPCPFIFEVAGEEVIAIDLTSQIPHMARRIPEADELTAGMFLKKGY